MTEPPRRKRFQIHLSTAIVLMFVAGALIWANVNPRVSSHGSGWNSNKPSWDRQASDYVETTEPEFYAKSELDGWGWDGFRYIWYGWPLDARLHFTNVIIRRNGENISPPAEFPPEWHTIPALVNAIIALTVLFAVWFLSEYRIRRRAARKGA